MRPPAARPATAAPAPKPPAPVRPPAAAPAKAAVKPPPAPAPAPRTASSDSPRAECGTRTEFALYRCMQMECSQARWSKHPQCVRLRETDTVE
jgi:hypothetical protein